MNQVDAAPRRLHPLSIAMDMVSSLPQTLIGLPALAVFVGRVGWYWIVPIIITGLAVNLLIDWLKWRRFTYAITADAVVIESGLLSRNRRILPLDRVQDVDIERRPVQRLLGLAKVSLETGGAGKDEAVLDGVTLAEAERLRTVVRGRAAAHPGQDATDTADGEAAPPPAPADATVLFARGPGRILLLGLFSFSLVWMAVLFGALQYVDDIPGNWIGDIDIDRRAIMARMTVALGLSLLALFAVLGVIAGVVGTVLREAGFRLTDEGGRLRRVRGLLTRTEAVVALRRVQLALVTTGLVRGALGWSALSLQTLGGSGDTGGRQVVAPFATGDELDRVLAVTPMRRMTLARMQQVSSAHVFRALARAAVPIGLVAGVSMAAGVGWIALIVAPILVTRALLVRRFHRYARGEGQLSVARGVLSRRLWLIPERNVQTVTIRRSVLQRWLGSATLVPDTAGGAGASARISDMPAATAWAMATTLAEGRAASR